MRVKIAATINVRVVTKGGEMAVSKFEAYLVHAHVRPGSTVETPLDYPLFARQVGALAGASSTASFGERIVTVRSAEFDRAVISMDLLVGQKGDELLIYDLVTGTATEQHLSSQEVPVRSVAVAFDPQSRVLVVEKRRPGITIAELERYFALLAERSWPEASYLFTLAPLPAASFAAEVSSLSRVRQARIRVARPNSSWTKDAITILQKEGASSNAAKITLEATANSGESLSLVDGIVPEIIALADAANPSVEDAAVVGTEEDSLREKTIRLARHVVHRFRDVGDRVTGRLHSAARSALTDIVEARQSTGDANPES